MSADVVEIVITGPRFMMPRLARHLVDERLAACTQLSDIESTYRWQGKVEQDRETRAAVHTTRDHVAEVESRIRELHPYDVPCIIVVDLVETTPEYEAWVRAETSPPPGD